MVNTAGMVLWLVVFVLALFFYIAQLRLFTISKTLKEIRDELRAARKTGGAAATDTAREKIIMRRILDGSLVPSVVGAGQTVKCGKCGGASTLRCKNCGGCEHCCACEPAVS
jgi:hypothetical protein